MAFSAFFCCETCNVEGVAGRADLAAMSEFQSKHEGHNTHINSLGYPGMGLPDYIQYQQKQNRKFNHPVRKLIRFITRQDYRYGKERRDTRWDSEEPRTSGPEEQA